MRSRRNRAAMRSNRTRSSPFDLARESTRPFYSERRIVRPEAGVAGRAEFSRLSLGMMTPRLWVLAFWGTPVPLQCQDRPMRLSGEVADNGQLWRVGLALTRAEAAELRDALDELIGCFDRSEVAAWHAHISSSDFQTEIKVSAE